MLVGVVDGDAEVLYRRRASARATARSTSSSRRSRRELRRRARGLSRRPSAIGLGIPCTIDRERGLAISAVNLPIVDVPIRDLIAERLGLPIFVDNDANVAALAEHRFGAARGARNAVMLTIGTGIGGGLILDGELYRGSTGAGAELGHVVIDEDGPAVSGQLPQPRLRRGARLGHRARPRGRAIAAERDPDSALGALLAAGRARSTAGGHRARRSPATRSRSRWWRRSAAGSASPSRASPTSSSPT